MISNQESLQLVLFCPLFPPAVLGGGPIRTIEAMVGSAPLGVEVSVVTSDTDLGQVVKLPVASDVWVKLSEQSRVMYVSQSSRTAKFRAFRSVRSGSPQVLYLNGYFSFWSSILPRILARFKYLRPQMVVIAPRGEFGQSALALRSVKKALFILVYRVLGLHRGIIWHASSGHEAKDIERVFGRKVRIIIRENDTLLPVVAADPPTSNVQDLEAVFIGRISPIKGLLVLLESLQAVQSRMSLDVYGPEEDVDYSAKCRAMTDRLPLNVTVRFHGPIKHESVRNTLSRYCILLMPTEGENFGHVIAEALSVACPVMVAETTPWTPVIRDGGGIVVNGTDVASWAGSVRAYCALAPSQWRVNRDRARASYRNWQLKRADDEHLFSMFRAELERKENG